jgi:hypothetical protein
MYICAHTFHTLRPRQGHYRANYLHIAREARQNELERLADLKTHTCTEGLCVCVRERVCVCERERESVREREREGEIERRNRERKRNRERATDTHTHAHTLNIRIYTCTRRSINKQTCTCVFILSIFILSSLWHRAVIMGIRINTVISNRARLGTTILRTASYAMPHIEAGPSLLLS